MTQTARLYGGSLYDLAAEEKITEEVLGQMKEVLQIFRDNPDYLRLLSEPSIPKKERTDLIEQAFGDQAQRYLTNFMKLLCEKGLLGEFGGCLEEFTRRYNTDNHIAEAVVTSAVPLSDAQRQTLVEKLSKLSGKKIVLFEKIDPSVLAGISVELEGKQMDGTTKSRLSGISRKLNTTIV